MVEDVRENEMQELHSIDYVRVISGIDSGKISGNDFIGILNIISPNNALLLNSSHNMDDLLTCTFWGYIEIGLPVNSPFDRFSGISMKIGAHCFQIAFSTHGGIKTRGSYNSGQTWSSWV